MFTIALSHFFLLLSTTFRQCQSFNEKNNADIALKKEQLNSLLKIKIGPGIAIYSGATGFLLAGTAFIMAREAINEFVKEKIIAFEQEIINRYISESISVLCFVSSITLFSIGLSILLSIISVTQTCPTIINDKINFLQEDNVKNFDSFLNEWNFVCYSVNKN